MCELDRSAAMIERSGCRLCQLAGTKVLPESRFAVGRYVARIKQAGIDLDDWLAPAQG